MTALIAVLLLLPPDAPHPLEIAPATPTQIAATEALFDEVATHPEARGLVRAESICPDAAVLVAAKTAWAALREDAFTVLQQQPCTGGELARWVDAPSDLLEIREILRARPWLAAVAVIRITDRLRTTTDVATSAVLAVAAGEALARAPWLGPLVVSRAKDGLASKDGKLTWSLLVALAHESPEAALGGLGRVRPGDREAWLDVVVAHPLTRGKWRGFVTQLRRAEAGRHAVLRVPGEDANLVREAVVVWTTPTPKSTKRAALKRVAALTLPRSR